MAEVLCDRHSDRREDLVGRRLAGETSRKEQRKNYQRKNTPDLYMQLITSHSFLQLVLSWENDSVCFSMVCLCVCVCVCALECVCVCARSQPRGGRSLCVHS